MVFSPLQNSQPHLVLQRTFIPVDCTACYLALAMRDMSGVASLLPRGHEGQRRLGVKGSLGQDRAQEHRQAGEP